MGFHGYAENAEDQLARMTRLSAAERWLLCSIQALHPFYTRSDGAVVASWMTSLDRENAILDNIAYVKSVVDSLLSSTKRGRFVCFAGFSQGSAMAWRSACHYDGSSAVVAVGGDIPPELTLDQISRLKRALVARGEHDRRYPVDRLRKDLERLRGANCPTTVVQTEGGHAWGEGLDGSVSRFLEQIHSDDGKY